MICIVAEPEGVIFEALSRRFCVVDWPKVQVEPMSSPGMWPA